MPTTHAEIRRLIQRNLDRGLNLAEKAQVAVHLDGCSECRSYAEELTEVEVLLVSVMKRRWSARPLPLHVTASGTWKKSEAQPGRDLVTRMAIAAAVMLTFVFGAWQLVSSGSQPSGHSPVTILPVPSPSARSTSTTVTLENCEIIRYRVGRDETLAELARRFSVAEADIVALNNLQTRSLTAAMELMIPVCSFTPTVTIESPATLTTTLTPMLSPVLTTPAERY